MQAKTKLSLIKKLFIESDIKVPATPISAPVQIATNNDKKPIIDHVTPTNPVPKPADIALNSQPLKNLPQETPSNKSNMLDKDESEINNFILEWAEAWSAKNINAYLAKYSSNFKTAGGEEYSDWQNLRRNKILSKALISIEISDLKITRKDDSFAQVTFKQKYTSNKLSQLSRKTLLLRKDGPSWFIEQEYSGN